MIDTDKYEEFENAMNEGRIERVHCLWVLAEVKRLREENALLASQIRLAYEWVEAFHNEGTMISFIEHVYGDEKE
jgi:hypothetical protein